MPTVALPSTLNQAEKESMKQVDWTHTHFCPQLTHQTLACLLAHLKPHAKQYIQMENRLLEARYRVGCLLQFGSAVIPDAKD